MGEGRHTRLVRASVITALWVVLGYAGTVLPSAAADAAAFQQAITSCRPIADLAARAACYDYIVDRTLPPGMKPSANLVQPAQPSLANPAGVAAASAQPAPSAPAPAQAEKPPSEAEFGLQAAETPQITVEVANVAYSDSKKLRFTTTAGIAWDQTDDTSLRWPGVGDKVVIKATMIGGNRCKVGRHWVACKRAR